MEGRSTQPPITKQKSEESQQVGQSSATMRVLTLTDRGASFHRLSASNTLEIDKDFPTFPAATLAKFAPYSGEFAVIADDLGLHFVDTRLGKETKLITKITATGALDISPKDTYLITCDKFQ
jgi:hypothetical protein